MPIQILFIAVALSMGVSYLLVATPKESQPGAPSITYDEMEALFNSSVADEETAAELTELVTTYGQAANTGDVDGIRDVSTKDWLNYLTGGNEAGQKAATPEPEVTREFEMTVNDVRETPDGTVVAFADRTLIDSGETKTFLIIARPSDDGTLLLDLIFPEVILTDVRLATPDPMVSSDAPFRITAEELKRNGLPPREDLIFRPATPAATP